jgi:hypothetical protein
MTTCFFVKDRPSAAYRTIRARTTSRYGDVYRRAAASRRRSGAVRTMRYGLARGIGARVALEWLV